VADWTVHAREALSRGPAALVTILATEGSAPRGPGARMVVTEAGLAGTIGGGRLEHLATAQARAILAHEPGSWRIQDYPLGPLLGQCCGGRVRLMVERLDEIPEGGGPFAVTLGEKVRRVAGQEGDRLDARGALPLSGARFVGLIGSQTKRARFLSRLERDGIDHARLTCPIGLPGLKGKQPEIIAIATLAQLLMLSNAA
jgi:xanthine/CO dehydrogenase XdhC/CoxF family maturation factor